MGIAQIDVHKLLPTQISAQTILFVMVAGIAAITAMGVVGFRQPVRSALCLVINFLSLSVLYFMLSAEMLGITQIVVYTGAIMVLFLFVIMLLNLGAPNALKETRDLKRLFAGVFGLALFVLILTQVVLPLAGIQTPVATEQFGTPPAMGRSLLTDYVWPFEMASVLLLVGIVGSILLVKGDRDDSSNAIDRRLHHHRLNPYEYLDLSKTNEIEEQIMVPLWTFLALGLFMFCTGVTGVIVRRNPIVVFMCIELMLNSVNLTFLAFARYAPWTHTMKYANPAQSWMSGEMIVIFVMAVAAAEVAVGLGIIMAIFRLRHDVDIDEMNLLSG